MIYLSTLNILAHDNKSICMHPSLFLSVWNTDWQESILLLAVLQTEVSRIHPRVHKDKTFEQIN